MYGTTNGTEQPVQCGKEKESWRTHNFRFQLILQSCSRPNKMLRHQNRATKGTGYKFGHTPTIMCSMNLPQSRQEYQKGKGQSLQQMVLGKPDSYTQKNEIRLLLYTIHTHTKQFRDLNVRPETLKILQEGRQ